MIKNSKDHLVPDPQVWVEFGVSAMTGWRWTNDPEMGFPPLIKIRTRNYRSRGELDRFKERMVQEYLLARKGGQASKPAQLRPPPQQPQQPDTPRRKATTEPGINPKARIVATDDNPYLHGDVARRKAFELYRVFPVVEDYWKAMSALAEIIPCQSDIAGDRKRGYIKLLEI